VSPPAEFARRRRAEVVRASLELDHVDVEILRLVLQHPGITQEQIGDLVGLRRQQVNVRMRADKFQRALRAAQRSALEIVQDNSVAAARRLGELIRHEDPRVALRACIAHLAPLLYRRVSDTEAEAFARFLEDAAALAPDEAAPEASQRTRGRDGEAGRRQPSPG
jgi:hypothetical protein